MVPIPKREQGQEQKKIRTPTAQEENVQDKGKEATTTNKYGEKVCTNQQVEQGKDEWQVVRHKSTRHGPVQGQPH